MRKKYRLKFSKVDKMKFIGHLDLLKLLQRTINRAKLPISYSQGFNPHQLVAFAQPLSLGYETVGDYFDIVLEEELDNDFVIDSLNKVMPKGMAVVGCKQYDQFERNSAAILIASDYILKFKDEFDLSTVIKVFENQEVLYTKVNKKGVEKVINVKEDIFELKLLDKNTVFCKITSGSIKNLKPEVIMEILFKELGLEADLNGVRVTRNEMYMFDDDENLVTLN